MTEGQAYRQLISRRGGGTVIHATLHPRDLVPAFLAELRRIDPSYYPQLVWLYRDVLSKEGNLRPEDDWDDKYREGVDELLYALFDALDNSAPEGFYFGAHEGDGSDFGWWPLREEEY